jgi:hypothetical protein
MRYIHIVLFVAASLILPARAASQESHEPLPEVVRHEAPLYPPIARTAHVEGEVQVTITTDGESVTNAEAEDGPPLLRKAAVDKALTWVSVRFRR